MWRGHWPLPPLRRLTFLLGKVSKTARSYIRPSAALRVPSRRRLPGPRGLRFAAQIYISRLRLRRRVLAHLALQAPLLSLLKSRICVAWNCAHEDQEQRIATLSPKPKPKPKPNFDFSVVLFVLASSRASPLLQIPRSSWLTLTRGSGLAPRWRPTIHHTWHYRQITPAQSPPLTSRLQEAERRCLEGQVRQHPSA